MTLRPIAVALVPILAALSGACSSKTSTPDLNCVDVCPAVVAAGCTNGPPSLSSCTQGCAAVEAKCGTQYAALLECGGAAPKFVCDASGSPYPSGCDAQDAALLACLNGTG